MNTNKPHIPLDENSVGIVSLFGFSPATAPALNNLAQVLLRGESTLSEGEREYIASYVSHVNKCTFCTNSHTAATEKLLGKEISFTPEAIAELNPKMRALLTIAEKVATAPKTVSEEDIKLAKEFEATDKEIHDTVLIAAAFCMFNRYVDGLNTVQPENKEDYKDVGEKLATEGYINS